MAQPTKTKLAILNLINEGSEEFDTLAYEALVVLKDHYLPALKKYFGLENVEKINLESLAVKRNLLSAGGEYNLVRAASTLLTDLRSGKLGGVCFDVDLIDKYF